MKVNSRAMMVNNLVTLASVSVEEKRMLMCVVVMMVNMKVMLEN
jgi:hypothetical protein